MSKRFCQCGAITENLRCDRCAGSTVATSKTTDRGYGYDWQQVRGRYLDDHPTCEDCEQNGIVRPAEHVHHVVPIADAAALRLEPSNLAALCVKCHEARHGGELVYG